MFYHRHDLIYNLFFLQKVVLYNAKFISKYFIILFSSWLLFEISCSQINKLKRTLKFLEKTTMKGKFQICIIVNIQWDTIKNVEVMFGSICHVVRLGLRDYPSVVVLTKMPYLVNMTIWSTLPILNDKWQMI